MKINLKRLIRDEKGHVLTLVLIVLVVGGLVLAPLLGFMSTGLMAGQVYERKTAELYAADAGVDYALCKIQQGIVKVPQCGNDPEDWSYPEEDDPPIIVNGKSVAVTIEYIGEETFKIVSTAIGDGSGTQVEAYVSGVSKYGDYSGILGNVVISQDEADIKGDVYYPEGHGPVENYGGDWPTAEELAEFYWLDVKGGMHYYEDTAIDLKGTSCPPGPIYINGEAVDCPSGLGPLYIDGKLTINNSVNPEATLTLDGTLYITGDTLIEPTKNLIIDLNGHTIFVESSSTNPPKEALYIKGKCGVRGPGVIIAVGDIYFEPNIEAGGTDPVFIMSVEGTTTLKPGGDFYGSIAGSVEVELYPGTSLYYPEGDGWYDDFNFLIGIKRLIFSVVSWKTSPL